MGQRQVEPSSQYVPRTQRNEEDYTNEMIVPKYVFFVTEYPKTASGKIQKFALQELGEQLVLKQSVGS